jgi:hypothetical protein
MSRITLSGNASGTGNFTLASPNSNTDRTLTLPDATGTVNVSGLANQVPAGSAGAPAIYPTGDSNTGIFFPAADTVGFSAGGTERVRIDADGIKFNGNTAAANALDSYEEGTWTPLLNGSVSMGTARYVKIGQLVFCEISAYNLSVSSIGTTAPLYISNAPFTMQSFQYAMPCAQVANINFGIYDSSGTTLNFGVAGNNVDVQSVTRNTFSGGGNISFRFSFTYRAAA